MDKSFDAQTINNQPKLRRPLTEDEVKWLNSHPECLCDLTSSLFVYGANKVYDLRKTHSEKPNSLFDDFIILFPDNTIEIWGVSSIQTLSELVK